jgi:hypothetical protein
MKTLLFLFVFISGAALSQTNIIAAKSHSSSKIIDKNDLDNFGNPESFVCRRVVKKVIYLQDGCIVESYQMIDPTLENPMDTICNHPFLQTGQVDIKLLKAMYPDNTEFIGFEKIKTLKKKDLGKLKKEKKQEKSSGLIIFLIGGTLFLIYLFIPKLKITTS